MYKVLIVDDEYYVVTLIRHLIDWQAFEMEVVGEASDGLEALEKIQELRPDIVVVDVCMPEVDGITLVQKIREINMDVKFIVISGHKKFEYAKSAIQYNVEDYLLKPIDKDELEAILRKLRDKLKEEWINEQRQQSKDKQLNETTERLWEYFIKQLLERRICWEEESLQTLKEKYHVDFSQGIYKFIFVKLDVEAEEASRGFIEDSLKKVKGYFREVSKNCGFELVFAGEGSGLVCLVNYSSNHNQEVARALYDWKEQLDYMFRKLDGIHITIVVGNEFSDKQELYSELDHIRQALRAKVALGCGRVYSVREFRDVEVAKTQLVTDEQKQELQAYIDEWDVAQIKRLLVNWFRLAELHSGRDSLVFNHMAAEVLQIFCDYLGDNSFYHEGVETMTEELEKRMLDCVKISDVRNETYKLMSEYREIYVCRNQSGESRAVRLAKKYIAANYNQDITLEKVAEEVNLSRVYFSILFKKETGVNFQKYVSQYRVETAKELLKELQYGINEIADKTGFQDGRYFAKVFKKIVGISPRDYRNRHTD